MAGLFYFYKQTKLIPDKNHPNTANSPHMIKNYLLIAGRNLMKRKVYSFINIFGLAIGVAVCLVILKYVDFELSYDRHHANGAHIYRTILTRYLDGKREVVEEHS